MSDEASASEGEGSSTSYGEDLSDEEATKHIMGGTRGKLRLKGAVFAGKATPASEDDEERLHNYRFPDGVHSVGATDSVDASKLQICQLCRHLNPDFMQCDRYTNSNGPWATRVQESTLSARERAH
jgi:hypothetical protein